MGGGGVIGKAIELQYTTPEEWELAMKWPKASAHFEHTGNIPKVLAEPTIYLSVDGKSGHCYNYTTDICNFYYPQICKIYFTKSTIYLFDNIFYALITPIV